MLSSHEMRNAIVQAIAKRSQTKFAKLFHEFDAEKIKKPSSIILLLAELNEQKDFYVDFNIPLKYFLDLYEELSTSSKNFLFNEAGLLVHNATKIYERRLECVLQRVEDQLASLSNGLDALQNQSSEDEKSAAKKSQEEKPAKKRKRLIESTQDPFEFQWTRRKFKKLAEDKRFGMGTKIDRTKLMAKKLHVENYLHPALWKYAEIVDLENEEDVDSKRNYRLFTSYVEHRYNTLVPDINFRLYYKMKDYLDADEGDDGHINNSWPPLSQAFVKQYLKMEDRALAYVQESAKRRCIESPSHQDKTKQSELVSFDSGISLSCSLSQNVETSEMESQSKNCDSVEQGNTDLASSKLQNNMENTAEGEGIGSSVENVPNVDTSDITSNGDVTINESNSEALADSGLGASIADSAMLSSTLDSTVGEISSSTTLHSTQIEANVINETANEDLEASCIDNVMNEESAALEETTPAINPEQATLQTESCDNKTVELTVHIEGNVLNDHTEYLAQPSPQNDEGVFFSDAEEPPMTPLTIQVDKSLFNSPDNKAELKEQSSTEIDLNNLEEFHLSKHQTPIENWPIKLNILEFPKDVLKKLRRPKLLTDLGEDMELYLKARCYKRTRAANESTTERKIKLFDRSASSASFAYITPPPSPCDTVLLGFGEEGEPLLRPHSSDERLSRLSMDSGVENDLLTATPDKSAMFFPPILEDEREGEDADDDEVTAAGPLNKDDVVRNVEVLENILQQAANSVEELAENPDSNKQPESSPETEKLGETMETPIDKSDSLDDGIETGNDSVEIDNFMNVSNVNFSEQLDDATSYGNDDKHLELGDDTVAKIQTWHRKLQPILAKSRDRHHFDVFQIGTNIISEFETKPDDAITFEDVMKDQDPSYVSRYFLSALLLANQGNIALKVNNKSDDRPTEWCDVQFELLSTTRHVVAVEDNIGMVPQTTQSKSAPTKTTKSTSLTLTTPRAPSPTKKSISPKLLPPPIPGHVKNRKRKLSTIAAAASHTTAYDVKLNGIETIKPISKRPRLSFSNDSGIASIESDFYDLSS